MALLPLALGAVTAIGGELAKSAAAKKARAAALDSFRTTVSDLGARREEERRAAGLEIQRTREDAIAGRSAVVAGAAERGITGMSVDLLQRGINAESLSEIGIVGQNLSSVEKQLDRERRGAEARLKSQQNAAVGGSPLTAALGIARTALSQVNSGPMAPNVSEPTPGVGPLSIERIQPRMTEGFAPFDIDIKRGF
jgi:hypothetical protein